uniref:Uncharacterized protein n=1 Tax=Tetranychus urticae TaxID=32264 RepID=T1KIU8_TETUR
MFSNQKIRISHDSEELNKVLILTLARAIHVLITGCDTLIEWCKEFLSNIMNSTPDENDIIAHFSIQGAPPLLVSFMFNACNMKSRNTSIGKFIERPINMFRADLP